MNIYVVICYENGNKEGHVGHRAYLTEMDAEQYLLSLGYRWNTQTKMYTKEGGQAKVKELTLDNNQLFTPYLEIEKRISGNYCTEDDCIPRHVVEDTDY